MSSAVQDLLNDAGVQKAKKLIYDFRKRGLIIFSNPSSGLMLVGDNPANLPTSTDMEEAYSFAHEISLYFSIQSLSKHFSSLTKANAVICSCLLNAET